MSGCGQFRPRPNAILCLASFLQLKSRSIFSLQIERFALTIGVEGSEDQYQHRRAHFGRLAINETNARLETGPGESVQFARVLGEQCQ